MIQDIAPWIFRIEFEPRTAEDDDLVLDFSREGLLCSMQDGPAGRDGLADLRLPSCTLWQTMAGDAGGRLIYAFRLDSEDGGAPLRFFLVLREQSGDAPAPAGWQRVPASSMRGRSEGHLTFAAVTGLHLHRWYAGSRFCGACRTPVRPGASERSLVCPSCGATAYPSIPPSVLVAVRNGERLLLTRYNRPNSTRYVLVAGYVEAGETAEQAAAREVMEEAGLRIRDLRYVGSQPWGLSGTLSLAFTAELDGSDEIVMDCEELAEACWISRHDIPPVPNEDSITMKLIASFKRGEW